MVSYKMKEQLLYQENYENIHVAPYIIKIMTSKG